MQKHVAYFVPDLVARTRDAKSQPARNLPNAKYCLLSSDRVCVSARHLGRFLDAKFDAPSTHYLI
jgi:hypothetical protein